MSDAFRWNQWNVAHIAKHALQPFPEPFGDGKWRVRGQTDVGPFLQVVFIVDEYGYYVIHPSGLTVV
ncbi:MAG TPA: hypothetical protein PLD59_07730 [Tepidisphaeraceae bacterium]|nr:hypothetical protein [Tepidisphaeraceae bacterium]